MVLFLNLSDLIHGTMVERIEKVSHSELDEGLLKKLRISSSFSKSILKKNGFSLIHMQES
jgi:hypothetical protein